MRFHTVDHHPPFNIPQEYINYVEDEDGAGGGSTGVVRKFDSPDETKSVVIKRYFAVDSIARAQDVLRETSMLAHISHDNVVRLVQTYIVEEGPQRAETIYSITVHCGVRLDFKIAEAAYSMDDVKKWMRGCARGLQYLHSNDIIPGNMHPGNLFIGANNELVILGYEKTQESLKRVSERDQYKAIEQLVDYDGLWTKKVDTWTMATLAFELIAGTPLFNSTQVTTVTKQIEFCGQIDDSVLSKVRYDRTDNDQFRKYQQLQQSSSVKRKSFIAILIYVIRARQMGIGERDVITNMDDLGDFFERTLQFNPVHRLSSDDAVAHPFLAGPRPWDAPLPADKDAAEHAIRQRILTVVSHSPFTP